MPSLALDANELAKNMIATVSQTGEQVKTAVSVELTGLAHRIVLIVAARSMGQISKEEARSHFGTMRFHVIATIAMATVLTEAAASKIVSAALAAVRAAVNRAIGFALVP